MPVAASRCRFKGKGLFPEGVIGEGASAGLMKPEFSYQTKTPMNIKSRFICESVTPIRGGEVATLSACSAGGPDENSYAEGSPSARLELTITNPKAFGSFVPGQSYAAEFSPIVAKRPSARTRNRN